MRRSLKIVGASGQGLLSIGGILAKALKRSGYCVFGYREYPSLIKGGHTSYQLDWSDTEIRGVETKTDILLTLNHHGLEINLPDLRDGGIVLHAVPDWRFPAGVSDDLQKRGIRVIEVPLDAILLQLKAKPILGNVLLSSFLWSLLGGDIEVIRSLVREQFGHKQALLDANMRCVDQGFATRQTLAKDVSFAMPPASERWKECMILTGSVAMGMGAIHAGVRLYAGYPMTPSSPLLEYIAEVQNETGMVIKQAEDEITAAQMVSGAMFAGTRALTATSGGGFDLMSETLSLNGIIENPTVFVLAQRPGPATGLPTWTGQGDLQMAVHTAHGEFARCVLSCSDSQDAFDLVPVAFNIAELYQLSVILLTDKQVAEGIFTQSQFNQKKATLERGIVSDPAQLQALKSTDRYDPFVKDGISLRWLPGVEAATYCAQGDEHSADGSVDESAANAQAQFDKRLKKAAALKKALPQPELFGAKKPDILLVGWGSTKGPVLDALEALGDAAKTVGYLHYTFLWPLRTELFEQLAAAAGQVVLVEGNATGQLGQLLMQECGVCIPRRILKYDGRPFFVDEMIQCIRGLLDAPGTTSRKRPASSRPRAAKRRS